MRNLVITCCLVAFAAPFAVSKLQGAMELTTGTEVRTPPPVERSAKAKPQGSPLQPVYRTSMRPSGGSGRKAVIDVSRDGHFRPRAKLNRVTIPVMVDTGASTIAINKSTAKRVGISTGRLNYNVRVSTANGMVMAARATLDSVSIGKITVRDVAALVLDDNALNTVLLGNSFLGRLKGYRVTDGQLILQN
ncbi:MAG: TIGR02281 family clan AA aspartic protease [Pseudomonadota bacterium]